MIFRPARRGQGDFAPIPCAPGAPALPSSSPRPPGDTFAEIAASLAPIAGRRVIDIGCGAGRLAGALARRGARVTAVDPDPSAVAAAAGLEGVEAVQAPGEALPFAEGSYDGAVFLNSLHHVPAQLMDAALHEAARVVVHGAPVLVVEPLAEGGFFEAMRPLEDETEIRGAAQASISRALASGRLTLARLVEYDRVERFPDVEAYLARLVEAEPARAASVAGARAAVGEAFRRHAEPTPEGYVLRQPLRLHHLVSVGLAGNIPGAGAISPGQEQTEE